MVSQSAKHSCSEHPSSSQPLGWPGSVVNCRHSQQRLMKSRNCQGVTIERRTMQAENLRQPTSLTILQPNIASKPFRRFSQWLLSPFLAWARIVLLVFLLLLLIILLVLVIVLPPHCWARWPLPAIRRCWRRHFGGAVVAVC